MLLFAVPNGGERNKKVAAKLRAEGVKAGVPDVMFPVSNGTYHGLFIEMKKPEFRNHQNGGCSDKQVEWINNLQQQNYLCQVCYTWREAAEIVCSYLNPN